MSADFEQVEAVLEATAPLALAEEWDNVGWLLRPPTRPVQRILLAVDVTPAVAAEAEEKRIDLLVAYHPLLFRPLDRIDVRRPIDRTLWRLLSAGIALYSPHTALDAVPGGVNDWLAEAAGEGTVEILQPKPDFPGAGAGRLLELDRPASLEELAARLRERLVPNSLRAARAEDGPEKIRRIALCAGAGADVLETAETADCLLTGEMGHHRVLAALRAGRHVILCGHTATERGFLPRLRDRLADALPDLEILVSEKDAEPLAAL